MKVLVTRAEPAASRTALLVEKFGHEPVKLPLFEIHDTGISLPHEAFDGYIFTSGNSIRILEQREWRPQNATAPVFCVGKRTAEKVQALGFKNVVFEQGGALKLAPRILNSRFGADARLLYFTTQDRSFDLSGYFAKKNISVTDVEIYRAETVKPDIELMRTIFEQGVLNAILTYSMRSSDVLAELILEAKFEQNLSKIKLIGISKQAIGNLAAFNWNETRIPPVANEQAMLHILNE